MFAKYDLKYLDDPEGTMGEAESINTMVRQGLADDLPEVYEVLINSIGHKKIWKKSMLAIKRWNFC